MFVLKRIKSKQALHEIQTLCEDGGNVINSEVFIHMLIFFVLESKYIRTDSDLLLNISLSVRQS